MSAVAVAKDVFADRKIGADQLPPASPALLPLDNDAEAKRAAGVEQQFGNVAPGIVQYTTDVLFRDLWLRPDLAPRDRSLVTVSALIASGQVAQLPHHLNRAMDNGLTQAQAAEVVTQLANSFALAVTIAHYPTGASKWNPIEHRLFSEVSRNWAGEPLDSYQKILNYARTTQTQTGPPFLSLRSQAHTGSNCFPSIAAPRNSAPVELHHQATTVELLLRDPLAKSLTTRRYLRAVISE